MAAERIGRQAASNGLGLETPWLRRQVEGHLVFGFFARRVAFGWAFAALLLLGVVVTLVESVLAKSWLILLGQIASAGLLVLLFWPFLRLSRYQPAIGWWSVKVVVGLLSFVAFFVGGFIGFIRGHPDAIHLTLLALVWAPSIEFAPSLVAHQRLITLGRLVLSVPLVILGSRAGSWTGQ